MRILTLLVLALFASNIYCQDIDYARSVLDTLCSEHFDGRGFYNDGEKRSADFIKNEYETFGLQKFDDSYFQSFNLSVNSIVGKVVLKVDQKELEPGVDFQIDPSSPTFNGTEEVLYLKKEELVSIDKLKKAIRQASGKMLAINQVLIKDESKEIKGQIYEFIRFLKFSPDSPAKGVIEIIEEKLTFTASQQKAEHPHIVVLEKNFPANTKKVEIRIENEFVKDYQSQNVIGYLEGAVKDSFICIIGHYDHLGRMGDDVYFPGANDNASGIAMLLSLAKELSTEDLHYSIAFIAFGSEEIGLVGSKTYTENPIFPLSQIDFLINLDILGTGDDGIQVVNGKEYKTEFDRLVSLNADSDYLKQVKIRGSACNSDHCFFHEKGVPSFFIYTLGGIAHYHNIYDKAETLPLTEYEDLFRLLKQFIVEKR